MSLIRFFFKLLDSPSINIAINTLCQIIMAYKLTNKVRVLISNIPVRMQSMLESESKSESPKNSSSQVPIP